MRLLDADAPDLGDHRPLQALEIGMAEGEAKDFAGGLEIGGHGALMAHAAWRR